MFHKKLDVMNEEFDTYVGALVADLIFRQYTLRQQTKKNLERVDANSATQHTQVLIEDLKRTEHLVYVDSVMNLPEKEHQALREGKKPINPELVQKRSV